jgi:hypothetical protein
MVRIIKTWRGEKFYATYDCGSFVWTQNEAKAQEFPHNEGEAVVVHLTGVMVTSDREGGLYSLEVVDEPNAQPRGMSARDRDDAICDILTLLDVERLTDCRKAILKLKDIKSQAINDVISAERERCISLIDIAVTHRDDDSLDMLRKRILSGATKW